MQNIYKKLKFWCVISILPQEKGESEEGEFMGFHFGVLVCFLQLFAFF